MSAQATINLKPEEANFLYQNTHGHDLWHDYNPGKMGERLSKLNN